LKRDVKFFSTYIIGIKYNRSRQSLYS